METRYSIDSIFVEHIKQWNVLCIFVHGRKESINQDPHRGLDRCLRHKALTADN